MAKDFVKAPELAKICGVKTATIKFYSQLGLLKYHQTKRNAHKIYNLNRSLNKLKEIKDLQQRGYTIELIVKKLSGRHAGLF